MRKGQRDGVRFTSWTALAGRRKEDLFAESRRATNEIRFSFECFRVRLQAEGEKYARHTSCPRYSGVSPTVTTITAGIVQSDNHADPVLPGDSGPDSSAGGKG